MGGCDHRSIGQWIGKGSLRAGGLNLSKPGSTARWHLDEMVVKIGGMRMYLWRAVGDEGEVLDVLVQKRRNKAAALRADEVNLTRPSAAYFPMRLQS